MKKQVDSGSGHKTMQVNLLAGKGMLPWRKYRLKLGVVALTVLSVVQDF